MATSRDIAGARWRKSTHSQDANTCVEVADNLPGLVGVRDSVDPDGPRLAFAARPWRAFVRDVKAGVHDL